MTSSYKAEALKRRKAKANKREESKSQKLITSVKGKGNKAFLDDYEPYLIEDWREGYFSYDPLKKIYKKVKKIMSAESAENQSKEHNPIYENNTISPNQSSKSMKINAMLNIKLFEFDEALLQEVKRVLKFMKIITLQINNDLMLLYEEMTQSKKNGGPNASNKKQANHNYELSLRSLYTKIQHLENFYELNYYCIIKIAKKFNKIIVKVVKRNHLLGHHHHEPPDQEHAHHHVDEDHVITDTNIQKYFANKSHILAKYYHQLNNEDGQDGYNSDKFISDFDVNDNSSDDENHHHHQNGNHEEKNGHESYYDAHDRIINQLELNLDLNDNDDDNDDNQLNDEIGQTLSEKRNDALEELQSADNSNKDSTISSSNNNSSKKSFLDVNPLSMFSKRLSFSMKAFSNKVNSPHDSHSTTNVDHLWKYSFSGRFFYQNFINDQLNTGILKKKCIAIYSSHFRQSYAELAEFELKYVKNKDRDHSDTKFYIGLKLGLIICMICWLIFDANTMNSSETFWNQSGLFIYTMIGNLLLYRLLWAFNISIWSKYEVSYISILHLTNDKPNLLLVANQTITLLLLYFINLMIYCEANIPDSVLYGTYLSYGCPFILLIIAIIYQFYEAVFMFGHDTVSRGLYDKRVISNILSIFASPFVLIANLVTSTNTNEYYGSQLNLRFRDIYCTDVLTSFNRIIGDSLYASCWIVSGAFANEQDDQTSTNFGTDFLQCSNSNPNMLLTVSFAQMTPLIIRAMQCCLLIINTNAQNCLSCAFTIYPQGYNLMKYLLSILVVFIGLFAASNIEVYYTFICMATLYKWWWDIVMDWGLCDNLPKTFYELIDFPNYAKRRMFLRDKLMYPSIAVYYLCAFADLILRFLWVLSLLPPSTLGGLVGYQLSFFLGAMEITRRSMWGIFRVEYEHLKLLKQRAPGFLNNQVLHNEEAKERFGKNFSRDSLLINPAIFAGSELDFSSLRNSLKLLPKSIPEDVRIPLRDLSASRKSKITGAEELHSDEEHEDDNEDDNATNV